MLASLPVRPLKACFSNDAAEPAAHTVSAPPPTASDAAVACRRRPFFHRFFRHEPSFRNEGAQLRDRAGATQRVAWAVKNRL